MMSPLSNTVSPKSKIGSLLAILETLSVIKYADDRFYEGDPILDLLYLEIGTPQLLQLVLKHSPQTVNMRIKRLKALGFIQASGVKYVKRRRNLPIATGEGRSNKVRNHLIYELTEIGKKFFKENKYLLARYDKRLELEKRVRLITKLS